MKGYLKQTNVPRYDRQRSFTEYPEGLATPLSPVRHRRVSHEDVNAPMRSMPGVSPVTFAEAPSGPSTARHQRQRQQPWQYGNPSGAPVFGTEAHARTRYEGEAGPAAPSAPTDVSEDAPVHLASYPSLLPFTYKACHWSWACLAVGNVEEACRASEAQNDLVAYAAALTLLGDTNRALLILESYMVGVCVVCYEALSRKASATRHEDLSRRHKLVVADWLQTRSGPNTHLRDAEYRFVMRYVVALVDWKLLHRWYTIALVLHGQDGDDCELYEAPTNVWFRYFLALFPEGVPRTAPSAVSRGGNIPVLLEELEVEETLGLLLSQCEEVDVQFISAVTAYATQRFRSCLLLSSRTLHLMSRAHTPTRLRWRQLEAVTMHFLRCRAALEVGERTQATADIIYLLQQHFVFSADTRLFGSEDNLIASYVSAVGASLALYGVPLAEARETVVAALGNVRFSSLARRYLLSLAGYVHVLTLLQVGEPDAAVEIGIQLGPYGDGTLVAESLYDVVVRCAVGLEDSTLALETPLSPHRLLYLALSPAFFGGLSRDGIRLRRQTATFNLLYPSSFSTYMPVRQMLPFHMNRAFYFFSHGNYKDAWDDVCCAVAAADEIVGSTEFSFTECFPLRVYFFGCQVGLVLLELLFQEEVNVISACLRVDEERRVVATPAPTEYQLQREGSRRSMASTGTTKDASADVTAALLRGKERIFSENDELAREAITFCRQWTRQMQRYYPHSILGDVAQVRVAVMTREADMLKQAVVLSRRYPSSTMAQNTLTLALYFSHNISEAVDIAQKNFQDFPHARDVMEIHCWLQRKSMVYVFNYRTLVPLRYKPGDGNRVFTKRMLIAIVLLAFNFAIVLLTCLLNLPGEVPIPESSRAVAVRLQLPSLIPLFFAAVFLVHAVVAAATPKNLIHTFLIDNHFSDTALSRFLFSLRGMALINVVNALQISLAGNNFLFDSAFYTFVLYLILTCLFVPFTTRAWFLPSVDEPKVGVLSWLTLLSVDTVFAFVILLPHIILALLEPFSCLIYYFFLPSVRPTEQHVSGSIRRRLLYHEHYRYTMPSRFSVGSGSRFLHVRLLSFLYWRSHSTRETAHLDEAQLEAEGFRAFPLVDPLSVGVELDSLLYGRLGDDADHSMGDLQQGTDRSPATSDAWGAAAQESPLPSPKARKGAVVGVARSRVKMPLDEPLLTATAEDVLASLLTESGPRDVSGLAADDGGYDEGVGASESSFTPADGRRRRHQSTDFCEEHDGADTSCTSMGADGVSTDSAADARCGDGVHALSRTSSRYSLHEKEQFQHTATDDDRLVDLVVKTLGGTQESHAELPRRLKRAGASFAVHLNPNDLAQTRQEQLVQQHLDSAHAGRKDGRKQGRRRSLLPDADAHAAAGAVARRFSFKDRQRRAEYLRTSASPNAARRSSQRPSPVRGRSRSSESDSKDGEDGEGDVSPRHPMRRSSRTSPQHGHFTLEDVPEVDSGESDDSDDANSSDSSTPRAPDGPRRRGGDNDREPSDEPDAADDTASRWSQETFVPPILPFASGGVSPRRGQLHRLRPAMLQAQGTAAVSPRHAPKPMGGRRASPSPSGQDSLLLSAFVGGGAAAAPRLLSQQRMSGQSDSAASSSPVDGLLSTSDLSREPAPRRFRLPGDRRPLQGGGNLAESEPPPQQRVSGDCSPLPPSFPPPTSAAPRTQNGFAVEQYNLTSLVQPLAIHGAAPARQPSSYGHGDGEWYSMGSGGDANAETLPPSGQRVPQEDSTHGMGNHEGAPQPLAVPEAMEVESADVATPPSGGSQFSLADYIDF